MKKRVFLTGMLSILAVLIQPFLLGQGFGTHRTEVREGDPRLTFVSFNLQTELAQGELVRGSLFFKLTAPLENDLKVFFHLVRAGQNETVLNADFSPRYPTRLWDVNQIVEAGPFELGIPSNLEPGEYDVRAGLLQILREEDGVRYLREPYTNPEIENFTVGRITVTGEEAPAGEAESAELELFAFDDEAEIIFWETLGAEVESMAYQDAGGSVEAVRVTILPGQAQYPGVILKNIFQIQPAKADWATYDLLRLNLFLPPEHQGGGRVILKITDASGRAFQQDLYLTPGQTDRIELPMVDLSGTINVGRIEQIKFFLVNPAKPFTFYISGFRLISRGQPTGEPAVTFVRLEAPARLPRGRPFRVRVVFQINQPIFPAHKMFVHVYRVNDMAGKVGTDIRLAPPIRSWPLDQEVAVDSGPLVISESAPPGTYVVRVGLYMVAESPGRGYVKVDDWEAYGGDREVVNIFQPTGPIDLIKQPYTNLDIQDWEVGTIEVE